MIRRGSYTRRIALAGVLAVGMAACAPIYTDHGYVPLETDLEKIEVGKSTRDDVGYIVGRPSSSGVLAGSAWYYVGSRFKTVGARAPVEIDRQVVAISFNEDNTVANVERFGLQDGKVIAINRRVTQGSVPNASLIKQLLGSVGNFSAEQFIPKS
jgi:outer membrane protein assembly factor BamE (lipoprotein component of BamABCDE complex)